jgi:DMSO/TMAO reductase YedYZ molybdopterin-dependent catalytic subunit
VDVQVKMQITTRTKLILLSVLTAAILLFAAYAVSRPPNEPTSQVSISFTGLLADPVNFTLDDIRSMPNVKVTSELICVSGESLGVHDWTGVRLKDILQERGVLERAIKVAFIADDGYATDLTVQEALRDDILVAYLKDGNAIAENTKLVVPGKWGYKWIDDIAEIRLVDFDFKGNWERRGYSDEATIPA